MIRDIEIGDIGACADIVEVNWGKEESDKFRIQVRDIFMPSYNRSHYYVFEIDGKVNGFAGMMPSCIMSGIWDFIWINVHPDFQKQRIGRQLTWFRMQEAQRLGATAIHLMTKNIDFFKKFGFQAVHTYYGDGWNLMVRQLKPVQL